MSSKKGLNIGHLSAPVQELVHYGLEVIEQRYGPDGETPLEYHGPDHTISVVTAADTLGKLAVAKGYITQRQHELVVVAAGFHDIRQLDPGRHNEWLSAQEMSQAVKQRTPRAFTLPEKKVIADCILATRMRRDDTGVFRQFIADGSYTSRLMADADLASLGIPSSRYWEWVRRLFVEQNPGESLRGELAEEFVKFQGEFLGSHEFHTEEAQALYPNKSKNIKYAANKLAKQILLS